MNTFRPLLGIILLAICLLLPAVGQAQGIPNDWSHHHLIFSKPSSAAALQRFQQEPRYQMQQAQRSRQASSAAILDAQALQIVHSWGKPVKSAKSNGFWSLNMGTGAKVGAGQYPAKYSFDTNSASCSDFVVFNTGLTGNGSTASIVAFNNLYGGSPGCVSVPPTTYWAYNTGGRITTSVSLSGDGTQVAFIQTVSSVARLVLLKWKSPNGSIGSPVSPASVAASAYRTCTAPCMTSLTLSGNHNDLISAPFYDYTNDIVYVGDASGILHKFTNIFLSGTPAEVTTSGWPVTVIASTPLSGAVFDGTDTVYVGGAPAAGTASRLYRVTSSTGALVSSGKLGDSPGIVDGPIVDPVANRVYVSMSNDGTSNCNFFNACSAVYQLVGGFSGGSTGTEAVVGVAHPSTGGIPMYDGTFDNIYFSSMTGSSPSGNFYVCGNTDGAATLYRIPINANSMGRVVTVATLSTGNPTCSPVGEIYEPSPPFSAPADLIYVSVQNNGRTAAAIGCPTNTGCVMSFNTTTALGAGASTAARANEAGGASGLIVDNVVPPTAASKTAQVYFSTLGNQTCTTSGGFGGCAIQASQSGLN